MDMLTDILHLSRMSNTVLGHATMYGDWGVSVAPSTEMTLHVARRGRCWFKGGPLDDPLEIGEGDLFLATRGFAHSITDQPNRAAQPLDEVLEIMDQRAAAAGAQDWPQVQMLCAKYQVDVPGGLPMLGVLPDFIHLTADQIADQPRLLGILDLLDAEAQERGGGSTLVVSRLVDTLLIFVLRRWFDLHGGTGAPSWFRAMETPGINAAVQAIHSDPARRWTVDDLSEIARQSRATFLRRFRRATGDAPMAYVTRWRMALAARALRDGTQTVDQIAVDVGYDSGAAFSKAFRKATGQAPAVFRKSKREPEAPVAREDA